MERVLFNRDRGGYNVIWEAGAEGTGGGGTGGAVAGVCGAWISCGCEFLENSGLSLRGAQLLGQGCHTPAAAETMGRSVRGGEPGLGERAGCGREKEAEGSGTAAQSQHGLPLPLVWMGEPCHLHRKGLLDLGLQAKQVVTGEQKAFWKVVGLRRAPDQSILRERSRWEPNFKTGSACPPLSVSPRSPLGLAVTPFPFTWCSLAGCSSW